MCLCNTMVHCQEVILPIETTYKKHLYGLTPTWVAWREFSPETGWSVDWMHRMCRHVRQVEWEGTEQWFPLYKYQHIVLIRLYSDGFSKRNRKKWGAQSNSRNLPNSEANQMFLFTNTGNLVASDVFYLRPATLVRNQPWLANHGCSEWHK